MKEEVQVFNMDEYISGAPLVLNYKIDGMQMCLQNMIVNKIPIINAYKGRVCFTGNRPVNLPWGSNENCDLFKVFRGNLKSIIKFLYSKGYSHFISGMALGIDIVASEIVLELKNEGLDISLECAIPCLNQTKNWALENIKRYNKILSLADSVTNVSNLQYFPECFQIRNCYMVDNSDVVIAVSFTQKGGTKNTINYAKRQKKDLIIISN